MRESYTEKTARRAEAASDWQGFRVLRQFGGEKAVFPLTEPAVVFERVLPEERHCLLGCENGTVGSEIMAVTVLTDDKRGGGFCVECAEEVCEKVLALDQEKMITGVSAEQFRYDRVNAAYKVVMRFSLREQWKGEEAVM